MQDFGIDWPNKKNGFVNLFADKAHDASTGELPTWYI